MSKFLCWYSNHVQELSLLLMATARKFYTCSLESQLLADHCCIIPVPAVITDRTPDSTITDLHCPLTTALTTNQMNSTICTAGINGWKLKYNSLQMNLFCHLTNLWQYTTIRSCHVWFHTGNCISYQLNDDTVHIIFFTTKLPCLYYLTIFSSHIYNTHCVYQCI